MGAFETVVPKPPRFLDSAWETEPHTNAIPAPSVNTVTRLRRSASLTNRQGLRQLAELRASHLVIGSGRRRRNDLCNDRCLGFCKSPLGTKQSGSRSKIPVCQFVHLTKTI